MTPLRSLSEPTRRLALVTGALLAVVLVTTGLFAVANAGPRSSTRVVTKGAGAPLTATSVAGRPQTTIATVVPPPTLPPMTVPPPTQPPATAPRTTTPTTRRRAPPVSAATTPRPAAPAARAVSPVIPLSPVGSADFSLYGYRWNPCQDVTISSSGPDVSAIVAELASITGLRLRLVSGPAEITVSWGAVPPGGEIGMTNWFAQGAWLVGATIVISPSAPYLPTLLRHELGHAVGLSHARQANEVMHAAIGSGSPTDYQAGDLVGLHAVGASAGC